MSRHEYETYLRGKSWTPTQLERIGFFDDGLTESQLVDVLNDDRPVTPTHHLKDCGVVLCTTGAFSPFHEGHLRMLEIAREEIEAKGRKVAGAFVCPDHDGYVSTKHGGAAACCASERIYQAQVALKDHPWIQVDPWAALYQDRPLNYTTILERLHRLLDERGDYEVVYVFGSDNDGFADAFLDHGYVCVGRPRYADPHPEALDISSTQIRGALPSYPKPSAHCPYLIRDDLRWATDYWRFDFSARCGFLTAIERAVLEATDSYPVTISAERQVDQLLHIAQPYISFDRLTGGGHWISRVFDRGLQEKPVDWLSSDLSKIPPGQYALIDDDIATGSTVAMIKRLTPQVEWTEEVSMTDWIMRRPWFDVVDARDFLFGARHAGLVIRDGDTTYRAPYITPWVNLMSRAKIPPAAQSAFVRSVIEANVQFFERVPVSVAATHNPLFWHGLGFDDSTSMADVSRELLQWNPN